MEESRKEDEDRALAFAALSLAKATIDSLEAKGVFDAADAQGVFERALTSLEFRAQDGAIRLARRIVEGAALSRAASRSGGSAASNDPEA